MIFNFTQTASAFKTFCAQSLLLKICNTSSLTKTKTLWCPYGFCGLRFLSKKITLGEQVSTFNERFSDTVPVKTKNCSYESNGYGIQTNNSRSSQRLP